MELIGVIQVPLSAFVYDPFVGRGHHPAAVKQLDRVFRRARCAPERPTNHAEGAIDRETIRVILSKLQVSLTTLRETLTNGKHPKVQLPACILCVDGKQRIAAARRRYGEKYWWTVRLFYCKDGFQRDLINNRALRSAHVVATSDGDIYRHLRVAQRANRQKDAQALRLQLSPCKEKILNQLLRREPPEGYQESVVDALDSLLPYPGVWEGLELANWHRYLALHWDEPIIHFLQKHLRSTYESIVKGVPGAQQYFDPETVRNLALRCPQNPGDALFIQKSMNNRKLFHGLTDPAGRRLILDNILSIEVIIPSLKTFHENMKYFTIGAKVLRQHILSDDRVKDHVRSFVQCLQWSEPSHAQVEAGPGRFLTIDRFDPGLSMKALFLFAVKLFPYISNERPKKDVRGEKSMEPTINDGFVYLLRREARRLGFSSPKIEEGLASKQPVCCRQFYVPDPQINTKWRCGKPGLRAFLHLYKNAFLPTLGLANGSRGLVPMFVARDFLDAFFGPDVFAEDIVLEDADPVGPIPEPNPIGEEQAFDLGMADAPQQSMPRQQRGIVTNSKLKKSVSSRSKLAKRRHLYSRERPSEARRTLNQRASTRPEGTRDKAQETVQEAAQSRGSAVDISTSPIEVVDLNAPQRSPIAPPELELSQAEPGLSKNKPSNPSKASRSRQTPKKLRLGRSPGKSDPSHSKAAQRWLRHSQARPSEARRKLNQGVHAQPKGTSQEAAQIPGPSVDVPTSPMEVVGQNAPQRSPIAPPELEPSLQAEPDLTKNLSTNPPQVSKSRQPPERLRLGRPPDNAGDSREDRIRKILKQKKKQPATSKHLMRRQLTRAQPRISSADFKPGIFSSPAPALGTSSARTLTSQTQVAPANTNSRIFTAETPAPVVESNTTFDSHPHVSFADSHPEAFTSETPTQEDKRKRKVAQTEAVPSFREWVSGAVRTYERPSKRLKDQHVRTSTTNIAAEGSSPQPLATRVEITPTRSRSREILPSHDSVQTPNSEKGSPSPQSQQDSARSRDHSKLQSSIEARAAPQVQETEANSTEEFHEVETFSETRTQSPGITYVDNDWGTENRSPVSPPESIIL